MSVTLGGASADTFTAMLAAARAENPGATVYVKTHPEVSVHRKGGYLTQLQNDDQTVVLRAPVNPLSLIEQMDRVYVVSSTMGFEALLAGKPVTCFGLPWYAGWGITDDRQCCPRRTRQRTVEELFAAGYMYYTRYLNPVTHKRGTIFDVIDWLVRQRTTMERQHGSKGQGRLLGVGFRRWKAANLLPLLTLDRRRLHWLASVAHAREAQPTPDDSLFFWGAAPPEGLASLARETGASLIRLEDGFVRSVGLGSDLIRPLSLVMDRRGIYFDATRKSDLEHLLNYEQFTQDDLDRARKVRAFIVEHGITKYNLEPRQNVDWPSAGRRVLLVPGQVEDDASIRLGCTTIKTNQALLQAVRQANPDAFVVYKPHPDVLSMNRKGQVALGEARRFADHVEAGVSVVSCIEACDEVHTMTSLTGFDALLRGKRVVTYGQPFYAGWGLTEDRAENPTAFARRTRRLSLDELVAGALLRYPIYWDWELRGYTTCEAVLHRIVEQRTALEASGGLHKLRVGFVRRQARKVAVLARAWLGKV
jgi:capsular polysaccharide export protein